MLTQFTTDRLNNLLLGIEPLPPPRVLKLALYTTDDGLFENAATGEVSDPNYKRQDIKFNFGRQNIEGVQFMGMTEAYTPTHIALIGNMGNEDKIIAYYNLAPVKEYPINEPLYFPTGSITINIAVTDCA